ncbi:unnamed protein product [Brassica oleracea]
MTQNTQAVSMWIIDNHVDIENKGNPERRLYRCGAIFGPCRVFKWQNEAQMEEFGVLAEKLAMMENKLMGPKQDFLI